MKTNKQKGIGATLILLIIAILVIIGLVIYINKDNKKIDNINIETEEIVSEDESVNSSNTTVGTTTKSVKLQNVDVQSSLVEKATGFVKSVYTKNGKNYIDIDYVVIYTKSCAETTPYDCPSGPSVKNDNPLIRTFELSSNVKIRATNPPATINFKDFYNIFYQTSNVSTPYIDYRKENPWDITIKNNLVLDISEHFLP